MMMMRCCSWAKASRPAGERSAALHLSCERYLQGQSWREEYLMAGLGVGWGWQRGSDRPSFVPSSRSTAKRSQGD